MSEAERGEMVERVARAMWERTHDGRWDDQLACDDHIRATYLEDARTAMDACAAGDMLGALRKVRRFCESHEKHDETAYFAIGMIDNAITLATGQDAKDNERG